MNSNPRLVICSHSLNSVMVLVRVLSPGTTTVTILCGANVQAEVFIPLHTHYRFLY